MSQLLDQILADVKTAMKEKNKSALSTLRTLHSDVKNISINGGGEITDDTVLDVLMKTLKQKKDSIEQFLAGGRQDLVEAEEAAISVLEKYLPKAMDESEVKALIQAEVEKLAEKGPQSMGILMKKFSAELKGKVENKNLSQWIKEALA